MQKELGKALDRIDQGAKDRVAAMTDPRLANASFNAGKATPIAADTLGKGASASIGSVADLRKLDLTTATDDQLREAMKVLDRAKSETGKVLTVAEAQLGQAVGRQNTQALVQQVLGGGMNQANDTAQAYNAIQNLLKQQGVQMTPGSLINTIV